VRIPLRSKPVPLMRSGFWDATADSIIKNRASSLSAALGQVAGGEKSGFARFESLMRGLRNIRIATAVQGLPDFSAGRAQK
jgi:hypothetical protein